MKKVCGRVERALKIYGIKIKTLRIINKK